MAPQLPISEMGTARLAITVARRLCRKKKITSTTITTASTSSICTCSTDAWMPVVRSVSTFTSTDAGSEAVSSGRRALMAPTVAITLAPGWRCTFKMMAGTSVDSALPSARAPVPTHAASRSFSALATTCATSFIKMGAPFFQLTIRFM